MLRWDLQQVGAKLAPSQSTLCIIQSFASLPCKAMLEDLSVHPPGRAKEISACEEERAPKPSNRINT